MHRPLTSLRIRPLTILFAGYLLLVGSTLNTFDPYPHFYAAIALALAIYLAGLYSLGWFTGIMPGVVVTLRSSPAMSNNWRWFVAKCYSVTTVSTSIAFAISSVAEFHFLGVVPLSPIGLYIDAVLIVVLTLAGIGYNWCARFVILTGRIESLGVAALPYYHRLTPRDLEEVQQLRRVAGGMSLGFGLAGLLFTILYSIVAPISRLSGWAEPLQPFMVVYAYSWGVIAVFVVAAWALLTFLPFYRLASFEDELARNARMEIVKMVRPVPSPESTAVWLRHSAQISALLVAIGPKAGRGVLRTVPLVATALQGAAALISVREFVDAIEWLQTVVHQ